MERVKQIGVKMKPKMDKEEEGKEIYEQTWVLVIGWVVVAAAIYWLIESVL